MVRLLRRDFLDEHPVEVKLSRQDLLAKVQRARLRNVEFIFHSTVHRAH
jgi:hypothetical protein